MQRVIRIGLSCALLVLSFAGCSTLGPDVHVNDSERYPLGWTDVREIEHLISVLGIGRPIDQIYMEGPDRASVSCSTRDEHEAIVFTVVRKNGHWHAIDKPHKERVIITS